MKILNLGATIKLGHKLTQILSQSFTVTGTVRGSTSVLTKHQVFSELDLIGNISADDLAGIQQVIKQKNPDVIINCVGILKQLLAAKDPLQSLAINALSPHARVMICCQNNTCLIQMGTDCVFYGLKGHYSENDLSEADDLYGKRKFQGEVNYPSNLIFRTSIIWWELCTSHGLLEWFISKILLKMSFPMNEIILKDNGV